MYQLMMWSPVYCVCIGDLPIYKSDRSIADEGEVLNTAED